MKTFTVILLALVINPVIANESISLYEKSGGYETSGGYERSSGYEKSSEGYQKSAEGYNPSRHGYQKTTEGYTPYQIDSPDITKRVEVRKYDQQIRKSMMKRSKWIAERHREEGTIDRMRSATESTGGAQDLIE